MAIDKSRSRAPQRPFYAVDPSVSFDAGMVAALVMGSAGPMATLAGAGSAGVPLGIFWNGKNTVFNKTEVNEPVSFHTGNVQNLKHADIYNGSVRVTNVPGTVVFAEGADYIISYINGTITRMGTIPAGGQCVITYGYIVRQADLQFYGANYDRIPDDTIGSGKITVIEGWSQLWIDVFETQTAYQLNEVLGHNALGMITNIAPLSTFAKVISVPSANDPWLGIEQTTVVI